MYAGGWRQRVTLLPNLRDPGKVQVGLIDQNSGAALAGLRFERASNNDAGGLGAGEFALVLGVAEKAQLLGVGCFKRRQSSDWQVGRADQSGIKLRRQRLKNLT